MNTRAISIVLAITIGGCAVANKTAQMYDGPQRSANQVATVAVFGREAMGGNLLQTLWESRIHAVDGVPTPVDANRLTLLPGVHTLSVACQYPYHKPKGYDYTSAKPVDIKVVVQPGVHYIHAPEFRPTITQTTTVQSSTPFRPVESRVVGVSGHTTCNLVPGRG